MKTCRLPQWRVTVRLVGPVCCCLAAFWGMAAASRAADGTIPGAVSAPYPTIRNLAVEWEIEGDDNLNGVVTVEYRRVGERSWHAGMPLRRVAAGQSRGTRPIFTWKNKHSGSIFDL